MFRRCRSSRPELFCKKGVLKKFTKFTGKHLCQSLFFNKVASLRPATLLKKRLWHRCFLVNFVKFLRTTFFIEHFRWLSLMYIQFRSYVQEEKSSNFLELSGQQFLQKQIDLVYLGP